MISTYSKKLSSRSLSRFAYLVFLFNFGVNRSFELLKQIGKVIKIDIVSEEVSKRRFARVCVEVDISKPLKMELKYIRGNVMKSVLIDLRKLN